jgi:Flp pilus assembly protein TadB
MTTRLRQDFSNPRSDDRLTRALRQKKAPNVLLTAVLGIAFVMGIVGFAWHVLWVVAVVVMALGLGFSIANSRRDRFEAEQLEADRVDFTDSALGARQHADR